MKRASLIALAIISAGVTAHAAEAGYRHWGYYDVNGEPAFCDYVVRRRGFPNAAEYYFVQRCFVPVDHIRYRRNGRALRSRG